MTIRKPAFAGQFYPADKEELLKSIEDSFMSKFGPGRMPGAREKRKTWGIVSPHAGYKFSGAGTARCFKEIGESMLPDVYIILGVNHSSPLTCVSDEDWETPLGVVKTDQEFVAKLVEKGMKLDNEAHHDEHSIEVQLPFLQSVSKDVAAEKVKIVCIMVADEEYEKWGKMIVDVGSELEQEFVVICSSDFTHYGEGYGYVPFEGDVRKNMENLDREAIKLIVRKDSQGFLDYVDKTKATICGKNGIAVLCWIMKEKKVRGEFLKYYTSGDVLGNHEQSVGYASIMFK